jgi:hypothetical protein
MGAIAAGLVSRNIEGIAATGFDGLADERLSLSALVQKMLQNCVVLDDTKIGLFRAFDESKKLRGNYRGWPLSVIYPCHFFKAFCRVSGCCVWIATQSSQMIF